MTDLAFGKRSVGRWPCGRFLRRDAGATPKWAQPFLWAISRSSSFKRMGGSLPEAILWKTVGKGLFLCYHHSKLVGMNQIVVLYVCPAVFVC
jgi:hypothetical protein